MPLEDALTQPEGTGRTVWRKALIHRMTAHGETKALAEWEVDPRNTSGLTATGLYRRLRRRYTPERALSEPRTCNH
jgi:hypothetical protein